MKNKRFTGSVTVWELAFFISCKLNEILRYTVFADHCVEPEDILRKASCRRELEFFYEKICTGGV